MSQAGAGNPTTEAGFTEAQASTLAALLDEVIPASADGALPAAGCTVDAGLVEGTLRRLPDMRLPIATGIAAADAAAREHGAASFADLARSERRGLLERLGEADPGLLPTLMFLAYVTYYRDDRVLEGLSMEARPPHPKGYEMAPHDLSLLDPVRRREKLYRDC